MSTIRDIQICKLPYQDAPFVHGWVETEGVPHDVWLRSDGVWTSDEGDERNSLAFSSGFHSEYQRWERNVTTITVEQSQQSMIVLDTEDGRFLVCGKGESKPFASANTLAEARRKLEKYLSGEITSHVSAKREGDGVSLQVHSVGSHLNADECERLAMHLSRLVVEIRSET